MRLPALLLRRNPNAHKNVFGHVLVLAGSARMLGAGALTCNAAMRAGAGLVSLGVAKSLNGVAQKKILPVVMTLPLDQTAEQSLALKAFSVIKKSADRYNAIAIGPGLSQHPSTKKFVLKIIASLHTPMIIDADALNAIADRPSVLRKTTSLKIITPHLGEMSRLTKKSISFIKKNRQAVARDFAKTYRCVVILKGHRTIVASSEGKLYVNTTGNVGMATAGSGDVLTGILAAFVAQGIDGFEASKLAVFFHGQAGDLASRCKGMVSLMATDIIDSLALVLKRNKK